MPVASSQLSIAPSNGNDVHWFEKPGHDGEQLKTYRHECAIAAPFGTFALPPRVADIQRHVASVSKNAIDLGNDLSHGVVIRFAPIITGGIQSPNALWLFRVTDMRGIRGIHKHKVGRRIGHWQSAGVGRGDVRARWPQVETNAFSIQIVTHVKRGSASAHGIDHHIAASGVTLQQLPNHPAGRCTFILLVALLIPSPVIPLLFGQVMLRGILPKRGGLNALRRFAAPERDAVVVHGWRTLIRASAIVRTTKADPDSVRTPPSTISTPRWDHTGRALAHAERISAKGRTCIRAW